MQSTPGEMVDLMISWLDPAALKRFALASRSLRARVGESAARTGYALMLVSLARTHLVRTLVDTRVVATGSHRFVDRHSIERHVNGVLGRLAGRPAGDVLPWTSQHCLRALYPIALQTVDSWPWAKYAVEWCATTDGRPELLALLHDDAADRLLHCCASNVHVNDEMRFRAGAICGAIRATTKTTARLLSSMDNTLTTAMRSLEDVLVGAALSAIAAARIQSFIRPIKRTELISFFRLMFSTGCAPNWFRPIAADWLDLAGMLPAGGRRVTALLDAYVPPPPASDFLISLPTPQLRQMMEGLTEPLVRMSVAPIITL